MFRAMALLDQTGRYSDLSLKDEDLIAGGGHVLCAYKMKPAAGYGSLEVASHFASESSTGTNVEGLGTLCLLSPDSIRATDLWW